MSYIDYCATFNAKYKGEIRIETPSIYIWIDNLPASLSCQGESKAWVTIHWDAYADNAKTLGRYNLTAHNRYTTIGREIHKKAQQKNVEAKLFL